jgi:hypothetical protein
LSRFYQFEQEMKEQAPDGGKGTPPVQLGGNQRFAWEIE